MDPNPVVADDRLPGGTMHCTTRRTTLATALTAATLATGCADPCFDDGLDQGGCPQDDEDTDAADGSTSEPTASDSETAASASGTGSATETDTTPTGPGTASGGMVECPELMEVLLPQIPTFQVVLDASGSMEDDFGGTSRWEAVRATLIGPQSGVVTRLQSSIRFGSSIYNNPEQAPSCPSVDEITPQLDAADELEALLDGSGPAGDTPTGEALRVATQTLQDDPWEGDKFLLLATDGEPDTCALPDPQSDEEIAAARAEAVSAVDEAFALGIRTFVVSVGDQISEEHLQDLANAGQGSKGAPDEPFYPALDEDSLVEAFDEIVSGLRSCALDLPSELMPELASSCEVTVNAQPYPFDDPDGWRQVDATQIELQGAACDAIQAGVVSIELSCTCTEESQR